MTDGKIELDCGQHWGLTLRLYKTCGAFSKTFLMAPKAVPSQQAYIINAFLLLSCDVESRGNSAARLFSVGRSKDGSFHVFSASIYPSLRSICMPSRTGAKLDTVPYYEF
jgi:hypothetical protein